jgi:hypothetical protein
MAIAFGDPEKKVGLYVIRIRSKGEVKVPPHCRMTPPDRPKANAPSAFPPAGHQNLAETLHIRRLEIGLERPGGRRAPHPDIWRLLAKGAGAMEQDDFRFRHYC